MSGVLAAAVLIAGLGAGCGHSATADGPTTTYPGISVPQVAAPPPDQGRTVLPFNELDKIATVPKTNGPAKSTRQVTVLALNPSIAAGLLKAFNSYYQLKGACSRTAIVPKAVWLATIKATSVAVAVAGFQPAAGYPFAANCDPSPLGSPADPPSEAVFERQPRHGSAWVMNSIAGKPFPCPPYPTSHPGPEFGYPTLPKDVLDAWNMPYFSPHCITSAPSPYGG